MKILFINSVCGAGSTGKIVEDLARELKKRGHQCWIAYGRGEAAEIAEDKGFKSEGKGSIRTYRIGNKADVLFHAGMSRLTDRQGFYSKGATGRFAAWIKRLKPDIIHLHNIHGYYLHLPTLFGTIKSMDVKVVWTLHDCWAFTGHCPHFDYKGCSRWRRQCHDCPQKKEYPASFFLEQSRRNYLEKKEMFCGVRDMTIVTPSRWLAELAGESFLGGGRGTYIRTENSIRDNLNQGNNSKQGDSSKNARKDLKGNRSYNIKVIHNGIDIDVFHETKSRIREKYGLSDKRIVLGAASQWSKRKGLEDFIRLSKMLDGNYRIVLIGLSRKQMDGLPENIIGIERTSSREELAKWYTAADVFVNPTYEDNYPTVNIEALCCNTPVVTYRTGGAAEMLENSVSYESSLGHEEGKLSRSDAECGAGNGIENGTENEAGCGKESKAECKTADKPDAVSLSRIVEKGDIKGVCLAVKKITGNPAKRQKEDRVLNGEIIKRQKEQHYIFSKERMIKEYMEVYGEVEIK